MLSSQSHSTTSSNPSKGLGVMNGSKSNNYAVSLSMPELPRIRINGILINRVLKAPSCRDIIKTHRKLQVTPAPVNMEALVNMEKASQLNKTSVELPLH